MKSWHRVIFARIKYALLYDAVENGGRAVYDESRESWTIPGIQTHGSHSIQDRRRRPPKPLFVDLDIEMPTRTTSDPDDPNTMQRIASILAMDLNDHIEEIPRTRESRRQDKLFRLDDVSVVMIFYWLSCSYLTQNVTGRFGYIHLDSVRSPSQNIARIRANTTRHHAPPLQCRGMHFESFCLAPTNLVII